MIYLNGKELDNLHAEDKEIVRVLLGDKIVWENLIVVDLGTGTSFNVANYYPKYDTLTADNFYFTTASQVEITGNTPSGIDYFYTGFEKTYNASTGELVMRIVLTNSGKNASDVWHNTTRYGAVHAYLISKPSKLISLGTARQTFSVANIAGYENFTADNFLIKTASGGNVGGIRDPLAYSGTANIVKTYNPQTGVLNCYMYGEFTTGKSHNENWYADRKDNVTVFLCKRI